MGVYITRFMEEEIGVEECLEENLGTTSETNMDQIKETCLERRLETSLAYRAT